ncbi:hypothetical protein ACWGQ5_56385 [Streptomyces sp. NPDC055722]
MELTPLSVGSPQEVIDKTMTFRERFGDYQRQLWNIDGLVLPVEAALEQVELLGTEVVPVLRKEMAALRGPGVPEAPTYASLVKAKYGDGSPAGPARTRTAVTASPAPRPTKTVTPPSRRAIHWLADP